MSKRGHSKNLSQQAIDLINYYQQVKQNILKDVQQDKIAKKTSQYFSQQPIQEEEFEESPVKLFSRTQHVDVNIYKEDSFELQQDEQMN
ncbi:hypothetical protein pb186bvf_018494 [Paramecium bursaria]